jgi:hypothetical protein
VAVRTGLLASRVRTLGCGDKIALHEQFAVLSPAFPGSQWPAAFSSLTVARQRGICTRFPILVGSDENARTRILKEQKKCVQEIYLGRERKSTRVVRLGRLGHPLPDKVEAGHCLELVARALPTAGIECGCDR